MKSNIPAAILLKPGVLWLAKNPDVAFAANVSSACAVTPKNSAVERAAHTSIQAWVWMTNSYSCNSGSNFKELYLFFSVCN